MGYNFNVMNIIEIMDVDTEQGGAFGESNLALLVPHEHPFAPPCSRNILSSFCILRGQLPSTHHYTEIIANLSDHSDKAAANGGSTFLALLHVKGGSSQHFKT